MSDKLNRFTPAPDYHDRPKWRRTFKAVDDMITVLKSHHGGRMIVELEGTSSHGVWWKGAWHCMDEHGGWDGWVEFKVVHRHAIKYPDTTAGDNFRVMLCSACDRRKAKKYDLVSYLDDVIVDAFRVSRETAKA